MRHTLYPAFVLRFQAVLTRSPHSPSSGGTSQTPPPLPTGLSGPGCHYLRCLALADGNHLISVELMSALDSGDTPAAPILIGWLLIFHVFKHSTFTFARLWPCGCLRMSDAEYRWGRIFSEIHRVLGLDFWDSSYVLVLRNIDGKSKDYIKNSPNGLIIWKLHKYT